MTYIVSGLRLPQLDGLTGKALDVASLVNDASSGRTSANINADVVVLVVHIESMVWLLEIKEQSSIPVELTRSWGGAVDWTLDVTCQHSSTS